MGLNWGDATPAPGGISGNMWRHFGCYNGWGESYWNLLGRNQGCCSTFRNTEDSSHYQKHPAPNVNSAKIQKPIPSPYVPGDSSLLPGTTFHVLYKLNLFFPLAPMLSVRHLHSTQELNLAVFPAFKDSSHCNGQRACPHRLAIHTALTLLSSKATVSRAFLVA